MTFNVEVLLKGRQDVSTEVVHHEVHDPVAWTDDDVRRVLQLILLEFDRVQNPDAEDRSVSFRGLSWIVTPLERGVAVAIEIPSGAVVSGPFEVEADWFTQAITRVTTTPPASADHVH